MRRTVPSAPPSDQELAAAAGQGDSAAFEELYRRHLPAATTVALAVAGNRDDAGDAVAEGFTRVLNALPSVRTDTFRSYLLTATRHAAIDIHRRSRRLCPTERVDDPDRTSTRDDPVERAMAGEDGVLLRRAFAGLPARWRSVLWLLEVEQMPAREVGRVLGISANNVAQIGVRARSRLRERYLQAHLGTGGAPACQFTTQRLGAYVNTSLSPRDATKAEQHLRTCTACRRRRDDLQGLGLRMRSFIPVPAAVLPILRRRAHHQGQVIDHHGIASAGAPPVSGVVAPPVVDAAAVSPGVNVVIPTMQTAAAHLSNLEPLLQRLVGGASAAVMAVGVTFAAAHTHLGQSQSATAAAPAIAAASTSGAAAAPEAPTFATTDGTVPTAAAAGGLLGIGTATPTPAGPVAAAAPAGPVATAAPAGAVAAAVSAAAQAVAIPAGTPSAVAGASPSAVAGASPPAVAGASPSAAVAASLAGPANVAALPAPSESSLSLPTGSVSVPADGATRPAVQAPPLPGAVDDTPRPLLPAQVPSLVVAAIDPARSVMPTVAPAGGVASTPLPPATTPAVTGIIGQKPGLTSVPEVVGQAGPEVAGVVASGPDIAPVLPAVAAGPDVAPGLPAVPAVAPVLPAVNSQVPDVAQPLPTVPAAPSTAVPPVPAAPTGLEAVPPIAPTITPEAQPLPVASVPEPTAPVPGAIAPVTDVVEGTVPTVVAPIDATIGTAPPPLPVPTGVPGLVG